MSEVALTGGIQYERGKRPSQVELSNIPIESKINNDQNIILFFGFRDSIEGLSAWRKKVDLHGNDFSDVTVTVDIGELNGRLTLDDLPQARLLNFRRIHKDLESVVIQKWRNYIVEDNIKTPDDYWRNFSYVHQNPEYINKLMKEPEFKHLDVIIFPIKNNNTVSYRAALYSTKHVISVEARGISKKEMNVTLPKLDKKKTLKIT